MKILHLGKNDGFHMFIVVKLGFYGKFSLNDKRALGKVSPKIITMIYRLNIPKRIFYFYINDNKNNDKKQYDTPIFIHITHT
jgi:hypothetical protein